MNGQKTILKNLSSLVKYHDSSLAAITHIQSIIHGYNHAQIYAPTASCFKKMVWV